MSAAPPHPDTRASSAATKIVSPSGAPPEPFAQLLARIIHNPAAPDRRRRERGFLIVIRGKKRLEAVQDLCLDGKTTPAETCLTARYRVRQGAVFGTVLGAFAGDLQLMRSSDWDPELASGDLLPPPGAVPAESGWQKLVELPALDGLTEELAVRSLEEGTLGPRWMESFLAALRPHEAIPPSTRLIVLAEIDDSRSRVGDWRSAITTLLPLIPKRMGVIISGAAPRLEHPGAIPADDPHFALVHADQVPEPSAEGDRNYFYLDSPLSGDQPADRDLLRVNNYADGLARLVLHPSTKALTIGIHGRWGSGKSSFMRLIKHDLIVNADANKAGNNKVVLEDLALLDRDAASFQPDAGPQAQERQVEDAIASEILVNADAERTRIVDRLTRNARRNVIAIDFNAWQYDNAEQIWAGLASEITRSLEQAMSRRRRLWARLRYAYSRRKAALVVGSLAIVLAAVFALFVLNRVAASQDAVKAVLGDLGQLGPSLPIVVILAGILWRVATVAVPVSQRILQYAQGPSYADRMGFQHQVIEDLKFVTAQLGPFRPRRPHRFWGYRRYDTWRSLLPRSTPVQPGPRIVVFIDDLDRCSNEKVVEILQAINLILGQSSFFVFIGMDTEMVYRAIDARYGIGGGKDGPANAVDTGEEPFSESYLRKIIQLSFHLPQPKTDDRFALIRRMFGPNARRELAAAGAGGGGGAGGQASAQASQPAGPARGRARASELTALGDPYLFDRTILLPARVGVPTQVDDTKEELQAFDDFVQFISANPREIKRLVNVHRLVRILLVERDAPLSANDQRKLVAWLIFCSRWPHLVKGVVRIARQRKRGGDCLKVLAATQDDETKDQLLALAAKLAPKDSITPLDLAEGEILTRAAEISQMVRDIPAPRAVPLTPAVGNQGSSPAAAPSTAPAA